MESYVMSISELTGKHMKLWSRQSYNSLL